MIGVSLSRYCECGKPYPGTTVKMGSFICLGCDKEVNPYGSSGVFEITRDDPGYIPLLDDGYFQSSFIRNKLDEKMLKDWDTESDSYRNVWKESFPDDFAYMDGKPMVISSTGGESVLDSIEFEKIWEEMWKDIWKDNLPIKIKIKNKRNRAINRFLTILLLVIIWGTVLYLIFKFLVTI